MCQGRCHLRVKSWRFLNLKSQWPFTVYTICLEAGRSHALSGFSAISLRSLFCKFSGVQSTQAMILWRPFRRFRKRARRKKRIFDVFLSPSMIYRLILWRWVVSIQKRFFSLFGWISRPPCHHHHLPFHIKTDGNGERLWYRLAHTVSYSIWYSQRYSTRIYRMF